MGGEGAEEARSGHQGPSVKQAWRTLAAAAENPMQLRFTKGSGKFDRLDIIRGTEEPQVVQCPKQGIIPHDMVHFAIESILGARGFLARVRDGEAAGMGMQGNAGSDGVERLVEVIQADQWSGGGSTATEILDLYRVTCEARNCPMLPLDTDAVAAINDMMTTLTQRWSAVPVGGTLELQL